MQNAVIGATTYWCPGESFRKSTTLSSAPKVCPTHRLSSISSNCSTEAHWVREDLCQEHTQTHLGCATRGGDVFSLQLTNVVDFSTAKPDTRRVERPITVGVGRERVGVREENESDKGGGGRRGVVRDREGGG